MKDPNGSVVYKSLYGLLTPTPVSSYTRVKNQTVLEVAIIVERDTCIRHLQQVHQILGMLIQLALFPSEKPILHNLPLLVLLLSAFRDDNQSPTECFNARSHANVAV